MGVQLIAIDCLLAEVTPKANRGRAFAISTAVQFCAAPLAAILALILLSKAPWGVEGWRWLMFVPGLLAAVVLFLQRRLPESPRWLAQSGKYIEANLIVDQFEAKIRAKGLVPSEMVLRDGEASLHSLEPEMPRGEYRKRLLMMGSANFLQAIGYYGFGVPTLLEAKGADLKHSLGYSAAIALSFPLAPLVSFVADRFERKHLLMAGLLSAAFFGMLFASQTTPAMWIVFGVLATISNNLLAFSQHTYRSEIFPTRIRSRSVGFVTRSRDCRRSSPATLSPIFCIMPALARCSRSWMAHCSPPRWWSQLSVPARAVERWRKLLKTRHRYISCALEFLTLAEHAKLQKTRT